MAVAAVILLVSEIVGSTVNFAISRSSNSSEREQRHASNVNNTIIGISRGGDIDRGSIKSTRSRHVLLMERVTSKVKLKHQLGVCKIIVT